MDIFVEPPMNFEDSYKKGDNFNIMREVKVKVLSLTDLIHIKKKAARPKDLDDIEKLSVINELEEKIDG